MRFPFDVFPSFWAKVKELAENRQIRSLDKVRNELYSKEDELKMWCQTNLPNDFFLSSMDCLNSYQHVITWADNHPQYFRRAKDVFLHADRADAWLVGYAIYDNCKICTQEVSAPQSQKSIKIPDACIAHSVDYETTVQMLRALNVQI